MSDARVYSEPTRRFWTAIPHRRQTPWPMRPAQNLSAENDGFRHGLLTRHRLLRHRFEVHDHIGNAQVHQSSVGLVRSRDPAA